MPASSSLGLCGLLACVTAIYFTRMLTIVQRIVLPLVLMFLTAIGIFLVTGHLSSIAEGWVDFPKAKSHTHPAFFLISHAYQTHGKASSQYIRPCPSGPHLKSPAKTSHSCEITVVPKTVAKIRTDLKPRLLLR